MRLKIRWYMVKLLRFFLDVNNLISSLHNAPRITPSELTTLKGYTKDWEKKMAQQLRSVTALVEDQILEPSFTSLFMPSNV